MPTAGSVTRIASDLRGRRFAASNNRQPYGTASPFGAQQESTMSNVKPIPDGCEGVIADLVVDGAARAIEFYQQAFGAVEMYRAPMPGSTKLLHAGLRIGQSVLFLTDDFPEFGEARSPKALGGSPVTIHQYVTDTDAAIKRAEAAGATVTMPAADQFWGDRYGKVVDPFGHEWSFATHIRQVSPAEMAKAAERMFAPEAK
jgi:uncharacterized glyoxalase superfamily protein PhnB